jgi:hypothetical protein
VFPISEEVSLIVEPLSDARTMLAVFFSILLLARSLFVLGGDAQFAQP